MAAKGYTLPGLGFAVELYRNDWILRAVLPGDGDATGSDAAMAAIAAWQERNRAKFTQGRGDG